MSMRSRTWAVGLLLILGLTSLAGTCRKPAQPATTAGTTEPARPAATPHSEPVREVTESFPPDTVERTGVPPDADLDELNRQGILRTVYFEYDQADLTTEARATLQANAAWLKQNPKRAIVVEGHCDQRGTAKYNLALGERRANSVREYLATLGVDTSRIRIISYGRERPADPAMSDEAFRKNRRGDSKIES